MHYNQCNHFENYIKACSVKFQRPHRSERITTKWYLKKPHVTHNLLQLCSCAFAEFLSSLMSIVWYWKTLNFARFARQKNFWVKIFKMVGHTVTFPWVIMVIQAVCLSDGHGPSILTKWWWGILTSPPPFAHVWFKWTSYKFELGGRLHNLHRGIHGQRGGGG